MRISTNYHDQDVECAFLSDISNLGDANKDKRASVVSGIYLADEENTQKTFFTSGIFNYGCDATNGFTGGTLKCVNPMSFQSDPTKSIELYTYEGRNGDCFTDNDSHPVLYEEEGLQQYCKYDAQRSILRLELTEIGDSSESTNSYSVFVLVFTLGDITVDSSAGSPDIPTFVASQTNRQKINYDALYNSVIGALVLPHIFVGSSVTGENSSLLFESTKIKFNGVEYSTKSSTDKKRATFYKVFPFYDKL